MAEGGHGAMDTPKAAEHGGGHQGPERTAVMQRVTKFLSRRALEEPGHVDSHGHGGGHGGDGANLTDFFKPAPTVPDTISSQKADGESSDSEAGTSGAEKKNEKKINRVQAIYDFLKSIDPKVEDILGDPKDAVDDRGLIKWSYVTKLGKLMKEDDRLRERVVEHLKAQESEGAKLTDTYLPEPNKNDQGEPEISKSEQERLRNLEGTFKEILENPDDPRAMYRAQQDLEDEGVRSLMKKLEYSKHWKYYSMGAAGIFVLIFLSLALQYGVARMAANAGGKK